MDKRTRLPATIAACTAILLFVVACGGGKSSHAPAPTDVASRPPGTAAAEKSWAGKDPAPAFPGGLTWFNVQHPLTLDELKGKVVLLDFWTLGCINCQQIIPDLDRL